MRQQAKSTVLFRLLACLLLLGTQSWTNGLRATHLPTAVFELGALPSEMGDQNDGPHQDREPGIAGSIGWSWKSAQWSHPAPATIARGVDHGSFSLLPVSGLQLSAP